MESTQECISLSDSSRKNWLFDSKIASQVHPDLTAEQLTAVNKHLKLTAGDDLWISSRRRVPKVRVGHVGKILRLDHAGTLSLGTFVDRVGQRRSAEPDSKSLIVLQVKVGPKFSPMVPFITDKLRPFRLLFVSFLSGEFEVTKDPHFLWITEFPLFTRDDVDKDHLAHGRWSSSHHPFTAPMWEDVEALYRGEAEKVRNLESTF